MAKLLVQRSKPSGYVYVADWSGSSLQHKMDHLACFIAATLAIGAQDGRRFDAEKGQRQGHWWQRAEPSSRRQSSLMSIAPSSYAS